MSSHRYWRVRFTASTSGATGNVWLSNMCFLSQDGERYSDSVIGQAANASSSSNHSGYTAAAAFNPVAQNGAGGTGWSSAAVAVPHWLGYDHLAPVDVRQVLFTLNRYVSSDNNLESPVAGAVFVDYSDDNVDWIPATITKSYTGSYSRGRTYKIELDDYTPPALPVQEGAWWNSIAGIPALGAWDAVRTTKYSMCDGVGTNHLNFGWNTGSHSFQRMGKYGDNNYPTFDSEFSTAGKTIYMLYKRDGAWVALSGTPPVGSYDLHQASTNQWHSARTTGAAHGATSNSYGIMVAVASTYNGATHSIFVNGVKTSPDGNSLYAPLEIATVGYHDGTGYQLRTTDILYAMAVFNGILNETQLVNLDAAVKEYLTTGATPYILEALGDRLGRLENLQLIPPTVPTAVLKPDTLGRSHWEIQEMLNGEAPHPVPMVDGMAQWNTFCSGSGVIVGTVKYTPGQPVHRRVRLLDEATSIVIAETWSDAVTGAYSFTRLNRDRAYTILGYDYTHNYRAVIADNIMAGDAP